MAAHDTKIDIDLYEIWTLDDSTHIMDIWVDSEGSEIKAQKIAAALEGIAHYTLCGIVVPDESYLRGE